MKLRKKNLSSKRETKYTNLLNETPIGDNKPEDKIWLHCNCIHFYGENAKNKNLEVVELNLSKDEQFFLLNELTKKLLG